MAAADLEENDNSHHKQTEGKSPPQIATIENRNRDEDFWESDEERPLTIPPVSVLEPEVENLQTKDIEVSNSHLESSPAGLLTILPIKTLFSLIWNSGVVCMAVSASIQSLSALLVKMTDGRVPIFEIVAVRSLICMIATAISIKMQGIPNVLGTRNYLMAKFIRGFAGAVSMSVYYYAVFKLSLSDTVTIFFTHPAMIVILAWLVKGETLRWPGLVGIFFSMVGVLFVAQPPFLMGGEDWTGDHAQGVIACLLAAFLAAIAFIAIRFIPKTEPSICVAAWFHFMGVLTAGIPLLAGIPYWPVLPSWRDSLCVIGVGWCSFSSHILIARSLQIETAAKASAAGYLQVVFAYIYGLAFLGEGIQMLSVVGSLVICVGVIATTWPSKIIDQIQELPTTTKDLEAQENELVPLTESSEDFKVSASDSRKFLGSTSGFSEQQR